MAKDPAFLFYPNDWLGGTLGMTFEEKGAYMEVLMMQFNRGHMEGHMIGQVVGQIWDKIMVKFSQDDNGLWYNKRLEEEIIKRKSFVSSRKNNLQGKNQHSKKTGHMNGHMTSHMEDVNENTISYWIDKYSLDEKWLSDSGKSLSIGIPTVIKRLADFKNHLGTQKIEKKTENDFRTHFINWARKQSGTNRPSNSGHFNGLMGN